MVKSSDTTLPCYLDLWIFNNLDKEVDNEKIPALTFNFGNDWESSC